MRVDQKALAVRNLTIGDVVQVLRDNNAATCEAGHWCWGGAANAEIYAPSAVRGIWRRWSSSCCGGMQRARCCLRCRQRRIRAQAAGPALAVFRDLAPGRH
ncbi:MAG: hypothetical protein IPL99_04325 [Candidatus Competibacteraceae bacterium]|nr:hypothetical protein [Candidatus Competibacteraceae bacterium]